MTDHAAESPCEYPAALRAFDAAICEALAVSQGSSERLPAAHVGYATYIFTRLCAHGFSLIRAAPRSRWVQSDHEDWNFSAVASHARALLEGYLSFSYLIEIPSSDAEWRARLNVMHLNDCTRRATLVGKLGAEQEELDAFAKQQEELRNRLRGNEYFTALPASVQRDCLRGDKPWIKSRDQLLEMVGLDKATFDALWILYSQHSHVLPLSFYRTEPNGRGTGIENPTDRDYIRGALELGAELLRKATDRLVFHFPDVGALRKGVASKFSPGPQENLPARIESLLLEKWVDLPESTLSRIISGMVRVAKRSAQ